jgi:fructose-1,6-bisphosphatase I
MVLSNFLAKQSDKELSSVVGDLAQAAKQISYAVQRSGLLGLHGAAGAQNIHNEQVQKLDEFSNSTLKDCLSANQYVLALASEEEENIVDASKGKQEGFVVAFDPLDGSSNIDINMPVGTIFSILPASQDLESSFLQSADKQMAAGYFLYGSSTVLVFSLGKEVVEFTLDSESGEFVSTNDDIKMPAGEGYISYNSANLPAMDKKLAVAYEKLLSESKMSMRYVGAMVGDVHRTLLKGGFFAYPVVDGSPKLRLQYECKPLGWLIEKAGGQALLDGKPLNEMKPESLHQKVAIEIGDAKTMRLFAELI